MFKIVPLLLTFQIYAAENNCAFSWTRGINYDCVAGNTIRFDIRGEKATIEPHLAVTESKIEGSPKTYYTCNEPNEFSYQWNIITCSESNTPPLENVSE